MQHTHYPDDDDYQYDDKLKVKDVTVIFHPSMMMCTHDYSCPVCRDRHAIMSSGLMQPCWTCQEDNWKLIKEDKRSWFQKLIG